MSSRPVISAHNISKRYGLIQALTQVSCVFYSGKVTVLTGPNGSGKSTLISILASLILPDEGYLIHDSSRTMDVTSARPSIGLLSHAPMLYPDLTGVENIDFHLTLSGYSNTEKSNAISSIADRLKLGAWFQRPVRTYSRGQLQRVSLANAFIRDPKIVLLDEPTTGLDDDANSILIREIRSARQLGQSVIIASHDTAFIAAIADHRIQLEDGRVTETS